VPAWLLAVVGVNFLLQVAVSAARPLTSVKALGLGADNFELGLLAAAYAALALLVAVPTGRLIDRMGPHPFIVAGSGLLVLLMIGTALAGSTYLLIAIQCGIGLALIGANLGMQSTIGAGSAGAAATAGYGHYSTAAGIGLLLGPALAAFLAHATGAESKVVGMPPAPETTTLAFLAIAAVAVMATAAALRARAPADPQVTPDHTPAAQRRSGIAAAILRQPEVKPVLLASAVCVSSLDLLAFYLPAYGLDQGYSVTYVGILLSISAAGSILARLLNSRLTQRIGRARVMVLGLMLPAAGLVLLPFLPAMALPIDMVIIGLGLGFGQPTTMAWIASLAEQDRLGATLGLRVSGNRLGQLVIPVIIATTIAATSLAAGFWALAVLLAGTAAFFVKPARSC
jgi:MFS family permease